MLVRNLRCLFALAILAAGCGGGANQPTEAQREIGGSVPSARSNLPILRKLAGQFQVPDLTYRSSSSILSTSCYIVHRLNAT